MLHLPERRKDDDMGKKSMKERAKKEKTNSLSQGIKKERIKEKIQRQKQSKGIGNVFRLSLKVI